jgi:hypothetical protein
VAPAAPAQLRGLFAVGGVAIGITAITGIISAETRPAPRRPSSNSVSPISPSIPDEKDEAISRT